MMDGYLHTLQKLCGGVILLATFVDGSIQRTPRARTLPLNEFEPADPVSDLPMSVVQQGTLSAVYGLDAAPSGRDSQPLDIHPSLSSYSIVTRDRGEVYRCCVDDVQPEERGSMFCSCCYFVSTLFFLTLVVIALVHLFEKEYN